MGKMDKSSLMGQAQPLVITCAQCTNIWGVFQERKSGSSLPVAKIETETERTIRHFGHKKLVGFVPNT